MVWGAICYEGTISLQVVVGRLNGDGYMEILKEFFKEAEDLSQKQWKFQQDGAPAHRPAEVKNLLLDNGMELHEHPPNSPDLNPIEMLWGYMKDQVESKSPSD